MVLQRIRSFVEGGTSILVGSVDPSGMPACCRGVGLTATEDLSSATVFVPVATSRDTIQNIASTRRIAVVSSHPIDHSTVQFKGTMKSVRLADDAEERIVPGQFEQFARVLETIGLPRRLTRRFTQLPAFAIEMSIKETFDQTPGPRAGQPLR